MVQDRREMMHGGKAEIAERDGAAHHVRDIQLARPGAARQFAPFNGDLVERFRIRMFEHRRHEQPVHRHGQRNMHFARALQVIVIDRAVILGMARHDPGQRGDQTVFQTDRPSRSLPVRAPRHEARHIALAVKGELGRLGQALHHVPGHQGARSAKSGLQRHPYPRIEKPMP